MSGSATMLNVQGSNKEIVINPDYVVSLKDADSGPPPATTVVMSDGQQITVKGNLREVALALFTDLRRIEGGRGSARG